MFGKILRIRKHWPKRVRVNYVSSALYPQMQIYLDSPPK